jgi:hypothetical protein
MSKFKIKRKSKPRPWWKRISPLLLGLGGLLLMGMASFILVRAAQPPTQNIPLVSGPRLQVDREIIDFGEVKMGIPIRASFKLTNIGNEPVRFVRQPYIQVLEGC